MDAASFMIIYQFRSNYSKLKTEVKFQFEWRTSSKEIHPLFRDPNLA